MAFSNKFGHLVLTTGNKSEMSVGYATLYGDMAGGFAVIKDVPKTMVYELARLRNQQGQTTVIPKRTLDRPPTAELKPDQKDEDSLPPYAVLDPILKAYVEEDRSVEEIVAMGFDRDTVARVVGLVDRSEYKRRQAPVGIKITHRGLGKDRRLIESVDCCALSVRKNSEAREARPTQRGEAPNSWLARCASARTSGAQFCA